MFLVTLKILQIPGLVSAYGEEVPCLYLTVLHMFGTLCIQVFPNAVQNFPFPCFP